MAKSSKKSKEATAQEGNPIAPGMGPSNGLGTAEPAKPAAGKKAGPRSAGKNRSATPPKALTGRKARAKTAPQSTVAGGAAVTDEEIRVRAYLISEWRIQNGLPGDSAHDWLEARRQLQKESGKYS